MRVWLGGYLYLFSAVLGLAQHQDMKPPAEKPVALYKGLGNWHHPIAAKNAEAQKYFDQGLALLYGFNRYEALRSFRQAAELDPSAVMPWWGMAMATGPYINMGTEGDGDLDSKAACQAVEAGASQERGDGGVEARTRRGLDEGRCETGLGRDVAGWSAGTYS